jgi:hypothetical protein
MAYTDVDVTTTLPSTGSLRKFLKDFVEDFSLLSKSECLSLVAQLVADSERLGVSISHCHDAPLSHILVTGSNYSNRRLNRLVARIIKEGLLPKECAITGLSEWEGSDIFLMLDFIDGDSTNKDISNLRLLCLNSWIQNNPQSIKSIRYRPRPPVS